MDDPKIIDLKSQETPSTPQNLVMIITISQEGVEVKFPLMADAMATYGMLKVAEKAIDEFYRKNNASTIVKPKGSLMNYIRTKH